MKTTVKQLAFAAPALLAIVLVLSSFKPAQRNSIANGVGWPTIFILTSTR